MKQFLKSLLFAALVFLAAVWILAELALRFPSVLSAIGYPKEWVQVAMRIEASRRTVAGDTLYIGDSVGGQVVPFDGNGSLCSNGSVYPIGNFLLVEHALASRPELRTVVYLSVPQALGHPFERARTCNNFIKPFLTREHSGSFDRSLYDKLDRRPLSYLYFLPPAKILPFDEMNFGEKGTRDKYRLSDFSMHWLERLDSMCTARSVELVLLCPPLGESLRVQSDDWSQLRAQTHASTLAHLFERYFRSMTYLPDSLRSDELHWKADFVEAHRAELLGRMLHQ